MNTQAKTPLSAAQRLINLADSDSQIHSVMPDLTISQALLDDNLRLDEIIVTLLSGYADRPALGERDYEIRANETGKQARSYLPAFKTTSYGELLANLKAVASCWVHHPSCLLKPDELVCISGFSGIEFFTVDTACIFTQTTAVPIQASMATEDLRDVLESIEPAMVCSSISDLAIMVENAVTLPSVRAITVFDYEPRDDDDRETFEQAQAILSAAGSSIALMSFSDVVAYGNTQHWNYLPAHPKATDRLSSIVHSSGSTGRPKGAMISELATRIVWRGQANESPIVTVGLAPLNHGLGRNSLVGAINRGGTLFFTLKPDMSTLLDDIRIARPTHISLFPRVLEMAYQHFQNEVTRALKDDATDEPTAKERAMAGMRHSYFGDRLISALVGGAPTSQPVKDFMKDCFQITLIEGYGNTEAGASTIARNNWIQPSVTEYKLRDVPELGYYVTDKPYPRGELCVKCIGMISGYYKQPEVTAGLFDEEGFMLTGDIVEEREPKHIAVIDRRKDVLKLSQGEYVAVGTLGTFFEAGSAVIKQIYIYGNSLRAYLLAVVVPDMEAVATMLGNDASETDIKSLIRDEMQQVASDKDLKSFEVPRDFILEHEAFSQENGLLTSIRKRKRPALLEKYGQRLEDMYTQQERDQEAQLAALKDPNSPLSVSQKLGKLLEAHLKIEGIDISRPRTFAELGGDSLGAVIFSSAIEEVFEVNVPADAILSPTGTPAKWAKMIEDMLSGEGEKPTFASVHGKGASEIHARDLTLNKFLDDTLLSAADSLGEHNKDVKTVLLTGGNGFLGHIACLDWMERLAPVGGKLICLIRGHDDAAAKQRLDKEFEGLDPELEQRYHSLAKDHLEVLAGDAGETYFGLAKPTFDRLASEVDRICHIAALVNHRLEYEHLFGPNVVGTAEIIRLAISDHMKPVDFVSTEAVIMFMERDGGALHEDTPLMKHITLSESYANGYAASKWAGEILLKNASERFQLPVNVFRGDMMLAHQHYLGQMNATDMFTRLLYSIIVTGLAPYSFYALREDGSKVAGHYNGTPVDMVAASVVNVADIDHNEFRNYNMENYHFDDGCSLDAFVDWIEAAGYPITRIDNYDDWFNRFKDKLTTLPEEQRVLSSLDILGPFATPTQVHDHHIGCDRFKALVKNFNNGNDLPHLDETFIQKCLNDMKVLGLLS